MRLQLARAGLADNGKTLTVKDIRDLVETHQEAPATIGHTLADHMPAMGWVRSVHANADFTRLDGEVDLIAPMREAFDQGLYKKWSIGARKKPDGRLYLHHLAFLGAAPPAFKDLKVINMAEGGRDDMIEFSFSNDKGVNDMTLEEAKKALDEANAKLSAKTKEFSDLQAAGKKTAEEIESLKAKLKANAKTDDKPEFSDHPAWKEMQAKVLAAETSATKQRVEALKAAISGRLPAAQVSLLAEFAEKIDRTETMEFSDAKKRGAIEVLQEIFAALPKLTEPGKMQFGDLPDGDRDGLDATKLLGCM